MEHRDVTDRQRDRDLEQRRARSGGSVEARLAPLVARQHGAFSRAQAAAAGATVGVIRRRVQAGRWVRVHRDVFRIAGAPTSWLQRLSAALLRSDDAAAASHRSALAVWALAGSTPGPLEITIPRDRRRHALDGVIVHSIDLPRADVTVRQGIRVTTVTRTLIDLAAVVSVDLVEEALDDALRRGLTSMAKLRRRVTELSARGRPGPPVIRMLLALRDGSRARSESVLETRLLRESRKAGLPRPEQQFRVAVGGRTYRLDFAYPRHRVAIEMDGFRHHSGRRAWEHDRERLNALTALGWRVLRFTSTDLDGRMPAAIARIRALLAERTNAP